MDDLPFQVGDRVEYVGPSDSYRHARRGFIIDCPYRDDPHRARVRWDIGTVETSVVLTHSLRIIARLTDPPLDHPIGGPPLDPDTLQLRAEAARLLPLLHRDALTAVLNTISRRVQIQPPDPWIDVPLDPDYIGIQRSTGRFRPDPSGGYDVVLRFPFFYEPAREAPAIARPRLRQTAESALTRLLHAVMEHHLRAKLDASPEDQP